MWWCWILAVVAGGVRGLGGRSDSGAASLRVCGEEVKVVVVDVAAVPSATTNGDVRGGLIEPGAAAFITLGPKDLS